jgi:dTDP-4-amino-4,6-dideoxygalactose transaminase
MGGLSPLHTSNRAALAGREEAREVPGIDLAAQHAALEPELSAALARVWAHGRFILGPEVAAFEEALAARVGAGAAVGCASGSDALLLALSAEGIGPGDAVITTPYTFFSTAGSVARLGATPVFLDIDPETFLLSLPALERYLSGCRQTSAGLVDPRRGLRVRGIIPVHLFGAALRMAPLLQLARAAGLFVLEDAAQAIGAEDEGQAIGARGEMGALSFFPSKNLGAAGDGGAVLLRDAARAERLRELRVHGMSKRYEHQRLGMNSRLDTLQAAILLTKLPRLGMYTEARRSLARTYQEQLGDLPGLMLPRQRSGDVWNQFVLRHPKRDALRAFLEERKIATAIYYPKPLHMQPAFQSLGYREGDCPQAEAAALSSLALPVYPELGETRQRWVIEAVRSFCLSA